MEFPVFAQLMVSQFKGFRFCLPEVDYERGDIQLTVEYADMEEEGCVAVTIWIGIAGDRVRGFLTTFEFEKCDDEDEQIEKLIGYINEFPDLRGSVGKYLEYREP